MNKKQLTNKVLTVADAYWHYTRCKDNSVTNLRLRTGTEVQLVALCAEFGAAKVAEILTKNEYQVPAIVKDEVAVTKQYKALVMGHSFRVFGTRFNGTLDTYKELGNGYPVTPKGIARALRDATARGFQICNITEEGKLSL